MSSLGGLWPGRPGGFMSRMRASLAESHINRIGARTVLSDRPYVDNDGVIEIGDDCHLSSHPVQSHLVVMRNASLTLGNRVVVSYGAAITARCAIRIGDDTRIGPFCLILDNDFHTVGDRDAPGGIAPIEIGRNVQMGARVTVLRGARIGDGATIMSGSTVAGVVAGGSVVSGVPARAGAKESARIPARSVALVVMKVFRLAAPPRAHDGPAEISGWTDVGMVRLLLALEEAFGVMLPEDALHAARTVAEVTQIVSQACESMCARNA